MTDIQPWFGPVFRDQPILAIGKVRFVGEPVVAVAAVDARRRPGGARPRGHRVRGAAGRVRRRRRPRRGRAARPRGAAAPAARPSPTSSSTRRAARTSATTSSCARATSRPASREADHVFEDAFTSPAVQHVPIETHACVADARRRRDHGPRGVPDPVHGPLPARRDLPDRRSPGCGSSSRQPRRRLRRQDATRTSSRSPPSCPRVTRRPVRLHLTREEEFVTITKHARPDPDEDRASTQGRHGSSPARARASSTPAPTPTSAPRLIKNGGYGTGGPHRHPATSGSTPTRCTRTSRRRARSAATASSQAAWAYETQMDMIAERLGRDALRVPDAEPARGRPALMTGEPCSGRALQGAPRRRRRSDRLGPARPRRSGRARRSAPRACPASSRARSRRRRRRPAAKLNEDGSLDVLTSSVEMGQGIRDRRWRSSPPRGSASRSTASRSAHAGHRRSRPTTSGRAPRARPTRWARRSMAAADEVAQQLREIAADLLEVGARRPRAAPTARSRSKGSPDKCASTYGELVRGRRAGNHPGQRSVHVRGRARSGDGPGASGRVHWHQAAGAAEVEVDLETGRVEVLRYHAGVYAGRIINPVQAELQTEGNVAFGLGPGAVRGDGLRRRPAPERQPRRLHDREHRGHAQGARRRASSRTPDTNEIHGIGETALPPVMPAIGNAVSRATGVRITDLPITPEKVLRGLRARAEAAGGGRRHRRTIRRATRRRSTRLAGDDVTAPSTARPSTSACGPTTPSWSSCDETRADRRRARAAASGCAARARCSWTAGRSRGCLLLAALAEGREITTVEGIEGPNGDLHPIQQAFVDHTAFQCSYCTPGFILTTKATARRGGPHATRRGLGPTSPATCAAAAATRGSWRRPGPPVTAFPARRPLAPRPRRPPASATAATSARPPSRRAREAGAPVAVPITLALGDYDVNDGLISGVVRVPGVDLTVLTMPSPQRHWRMSRHLEFHACEFSLATYLPLRDQGALAVSAIPAFPHRRFRHGYVFVNATKGIARPSNSTGGASGSGTGRRRPASGRAGSSRTSTAWTSPRSTRRARTTRTCPSTSRRSGCAAVRRTRPSSSCSSRASWKG